MAATRDTIAAARTMINNRTMSRRASSLRWSSSVVVRSDTPSDGVSKVRGRVFVGVSSGEGVIVALSAARCHETSKVRSSGETRRMRAMTRRKKLANDEEGPDDLGC